MKRQTDSRDYISIRGIELIRCYRRLYKRCGTLGYARKIANVFRNVLRYDITKILSALAARFVTCGMFEKSCAVQYL